MPRSLDSTADTSVDGSMDGTVDTPAEGTRDASMEIAKEGSMDPRRNLGPRVLLLGLLLFGAGCASVPPYEKEHLADPILALDAETAEEGREVKWLEAREGSTGGVGGAGGGCACN